MTRTRQIAVTLPLLLVPLAFSVALGGGERGVRGATAHAPKPVAAPWSSSASNQAATEARRELLAPAGVATAPLRVAREEAPSRPRPVEVPREVRTEAFAGTAPDPAVEDERSTVDYSPVGDPTRVESAAIAATSPGALEDYGAAPE